MSEATSYDIDDYINDHELIIDCLNQLKHRYYTIFFNFETGFVDKVVLVNTNKVYQFNKVTDDFIETDLIYNPEEDYCLLRLNSMIDLVPDFTYDFICNQESLSKTLWLYFVEKVYYRRKFKKLKEQETDEVEIVDQGIE